MFGSFVRGTSSNDSDIDILLITYNNLTFEEKEKMAESDRNKSDYQDFFIVSKDEAKNNLRM